MKVARLTRLVSLVVRARRRYAAEGVSVDMGSGNKTERRGVGKRQDGTFTPGGGLRATLRLTPLELDALAVRARRRGLYRAGADDAAVGPALRHALAAADRVLAWATAAPPAELPHPLRAHLGILLDEPELVADAVVLSMLDSTAGAKLLDLLRSSGGPVVEQGRAILESEGFAMPPGGSAPLTLTEAGGERLARLRALSSGR